MRNEQKGCTVITCHFLSADIFLRMAPLRSRNDVSSDLDRLRSMYGQFEDSRITQLRTMLLTRVKQSSVGGQLGPASYLQDTFSTSPAVSISFSPVGNMVNSKLAISIPNN
jgi:hypothetical protein